MENYSRCLANQDILKSFIHFKFKKILFVYHVDRIDHYLQFRIIYQLFIYISYLCKSSYL